MFLYLTAELASASSIAITLSKITTLENTFWDGEYVYGPQALSPVLGVSLVTLFYTAVGGLPVSLLTDRIQGIRYVFGALHHHHHRRVRLHRRVGPGALLQSSATASTRAMSRPTTATRSRCHHARHRCHGRQHGAQRYWQRVWAAESNSAVKVATCGIGPLVCGDDAHWRVRLDRVRPLRPQPLPPPTPSRSSSVISWATAGRSRSSSSSR